VSFLDEKARRFKIAAVMLPERDFMEERGASGTHEILSFGVRNFFWE